MSQEQDTPAAAKDHSPLAVHMAVDLITSLPMSQKDIFATAVCLLCVVVEKSNRDFPGDPGNPFRDVHIDPAKPFEMALDGLQAFMDFQEPREQAPAFAG